MVRYPVGFAVGHSDHVLQQISNIVLMARAATRDIAVKF